MGRRKTNTASGLAALIILCITGLVLFTVYVREGDSGPLHTVQLGAAEVLRPVRGLFGLAASPFATAGDRVSGALGSGREELQQQSQQYQEEAANAASLRQENERLRALLDGQQKSFKYAPLARVVAPVGGELTDRVQINVGTDDGVGPEQPVVVGNNILVGRTTEKVTPHTAEVMLVTDRNFAAGVQIVPPKGPEETTGGSTNSGGSTTPGGSTSSGGSTTSGGSTNSGGSTTPSDNSHGEGLLRTNSEGYLGVDYVDLNAGAAQGDFVVTSGRAGDRQLLFPPGLLVGTVESATAQDIDQYEKIVVTPAAKAGDLQEVRVIVDW